MGDASDDDSDCRDVFEFEETVVITNKALKLRATIPPSYRKVVDGVTFTKLDVWQSRGVFSILSCKAKGKPSHAKSGVAVRRSSCKQKIVATCAALRKARDEAFRTSVEAKCPRAGVRFVGAVKPRSKELHVVALQHQDWVIVSMPAVDDATGPCSIVCLCNDDRKNRNSELWVKLTPDVCAYLSAHVAAVDDAEVAERDPVDDEHDERSESTAEKVAGADTAQEQAPDMNEDRAHEDRSSSSHGGAAQPASQAVQSSLHAFFSKR